MRLIENPAPIWDRRAGPERFSDYRRYEFHGEVEDGIPTVYES